MVIFCIGKGKNEELPLQRKRQSRDNCCPSEGELNANKAKKIKASRLGKEGEDTSSVKKKGKDEELTVWRIPQDLRS